MKTSFKPASRADNGNASKLKPGDCVRRTVGTPWLGRIVQVHDTYFIVQFEERGCPFEAYMPPNCIELVPAAVRAEQEVAGSNVAC